MSEKIKPHHLQKLAVAYIRQSSPGQVIHHRESQRVQKRFAQRAVALGWPPEKVKIIDGDQGVSASLPYCRDEFRDLVQMVRDRQVGIVFGIDVARLARNSLDWGLLTHWCAWCGVLLADQHQVYDPALPQDSLLLGIQGAVAVHEARAIRQRFEAALHEKASRGELHQAVPRGYVVVEGRFLRKHPDQRVQQAVQRVFDKFATCSSVRQLQAWLWEQDLLLPRGWSRDAGQRVEWVDANYRGLLEMLRNPKYAGMYVYPRTQQQTEVLPSGKVHKTRRLSTPDEWKFVLHDHHPAYLTPQQYCANLEKIAMNAQRSTASRGAPNRGVALLAGLIQCRRCGHTLQVRYRTAGRPTYVCCSGSRQRQRGPANCFSFAAADLERQLSEQVLDAVGPAGVQAAELAAERLAAERDARRARLHDEWEHCRYEADLARRRLDHVDPANRLVFETLTKEWEVCLQAVADQESLLQQFDRDDPPRPTPQERTRLDELGARLEDVWYAPDTDSRLKQQVVRLLIEHVSADLDEERDEVVLWVKWAGGHHTELRSPRRASTRRSRADVSVLLDTLRKIADDESIGRALNRGGVPAEDGGTWTKQRVRQARRRAGIAAFSVARKTQEGWLTQAEAATYLGISPMSINRFIREEIMPAEGISGLPQVIRRDDLAIPAIQAAVRQVKSHGNAPLPKNPDQKTLFFK